MADLPPGGFTDCLLNTEPARCTGWCGLRPDGLEPAHRRNRRGPWKERTKPPPSTTPTSSMVLAMFLADLGLWPICRSFPWPCTTCPEKVAGCGAGRGGRLLVKPQFESGQGRVARAAWWCPWPLPMPFESGDHSPPPAQEPGLAAGLVASPIMVPACATMILALAQAWIDNRVRSIDPDSDRFLWEGHTSSSEKLARSRRLRWRAVEVARCGCGITDPQWCDDEDLSHRRSHGARRLPDGVDHVSTRSSSTTNVKVVSFLRNSTVTSDSR